MYRVKDWAEVKRLHEREGLSKKAIAEKLGMSRNTVARLMCLSEPPAYEREPSSSLLDPFREEILALPAEDPRAPATVIRERLQAGGYAGGITILKDYLTQVRPQFLAARTYQRTTYLPGEIGQIDWWHLPETALLEGSTAGCFVSIAFSLGSLMLDTMNGLGMTYSDRDFAGRPDNRWSEVGTAP